MMTWSVRQPVPSASDRHFGRLQRGIVGGCELAIRRQAFDCGIRQITGDNFTQSIQFFLTGPMGVDFIFCE
jgi:hypothetical protein